MSNSNEFNSVKDIFEDTLKYYNYSETTINELLTDSFINGLLELQKQEPEDNNAISLLRNFSQNQSLASLTELDNELRKELSSEGYISNMLRYINAAWMNVNFEENPTYAKSSIQKDDVDNTKIGISIMAGLLNFLSKTAGTGQKIIASEITVPLEVARRLHKTIQNQYDFIDAGEQSMRNARSGIHDNISTATTTRSPLVVDLDGDGVETTTTEDGTHFDHDNNGFAEKTSWVGKDDGLLVRDINGNGQIDDGTELFGNNSVLSNGQKAANGFEALKDLDSNNDGVFNSSDTAWNQVNVWKDSNQNGKVDEGELLTLEQAEIENIDLNYQNSNAVDTNGNTVGQIGSFDKENGTQGNISDIWFNTDLMDTVDKTNIDIPADIAALPNVTGFGNVHDLHTAMALDTSGELKALVQQYAAETDSEARQQILYNIIYHWTGVQDEPIDGRDPTQVYGKVIDDTRKLEALEEFMGEEYLGTWCWGERDPNPHGKAAPYILRAFDILAEYVNNELLAQTHYKPLLENVKLIWDNTTETWSVDVSGAVAQIQSLYNENVENGIITFREFEKLVKNCGYDNLQAIYEAFRTYGSLTGSDLDAMFAKFGYTYGTDLNDDLTGTAGVDEINGLAGNDSIYGGAGNDTLDGGTGNDNIFGENGDDILIGGEGNDYLIGGNGADTYIFNPGFGNDAIDNSDDNASANEPDIIQFGEGILASKTTLGRQGYDLIITVSYDPDENGTTRPNDSIRIYSYFDQQGTSSATVNSIVFADGTTWDYEYVRDHWNSIPDANGGETLEGNNENNTINGTNYNDILIGNGGNDTINAGNGNDRLLGGTGNDTLNGGSGDDTYLWNWGDGMDTISDTGNHDKISFGDGITYSDLKFRQEGGNLRITVKNNENQGMLINGFFSSLDYKIEDLYFQDGSIVHLSEIPLTLHQLNTDETINLTGNGDTVYANGGDDRVNGGQGNDTIFGGDGNDNIYGNSGNDVISGGKGDDTIDGGNGADTYIWNLGDGLDTIAQVSSEDIIKFGPGITFDNLSFRNDNGDLRIYVNGDDTQGVICKNFFGNDSYKSKQIIFNDGTSFALPTSPLTLTQKNTSETVTATIYNDTIYANGGADTVHSGQGDDVIYGGAGFDSLYGEDGNDTLIGGTGSDYLEGGAGDDTYIYNLGDGFDTIYDYNGGNTDNDTIKFGEGISFSDITFSRKDNNLIMTLFNDITQGVIIQNFFSSSYYQVEKLEFADGTTVPLTERGFEFIQNDGADNVSGTNYDDTIYGKGGNDTIYGYSGNDTLIGGKGNDRLEGSYGDDTYIWNLGDGFDTIYDYNGGNTDNDTIKFGEGISFEDLSFERDGNSLIIYVNNNKTQGIKIQDYYSSTYYKVEKLEFADESVVETSTIAVTTDRSDALAAQDITGTDNNDTLTGGNFGDTLTGNDGNDVINGGAGNDTLKGNSGNDTLIGGKGNDRLEGSYGDDTYIWNLGDGFDTIYDYNGGNTDNDTIKFGEGISFEDLSFEKDGNSLIIYVNNDRTQGIKIQDYYSSTYYKVEKLEFADGTIVETSTIAVTTDRSDALAAQDITGTDNNDTLTGGNFGDTLTGNDGNDVINGGAGNDTLKGNSGNDTLIGGKGNDRLEGSYGDDTYIWNLGDGFDTIYDYNGGNTDNDTIKFGEGISFEDLSFERDGNSLIIYVNNDKTQGIKIQDYYSSYSQVEKLKFADESVVETSTVAVTTDRSDALAAQDITGTDNNDTLTGGNFGDTLTGNDGNDVINGGAGNDTLKGNSGNDTLIGGKGNDRLEGSYGDDTYIWNLGDGFDTIYDYNGGNTDNDTIKFGEGISFEDLSFERDGNSLIIYVNNDKTQGIKIQDYYSSYSQVEKLKFADESVVETSTVAVTIDRSDALAAQNITGTDNNDILTGGNFGDTLTGNDGDDVIDGGAGNDTLKGNSGNDTLIGGKGNDRLEGSYGDDTYIWNLGDGFDTIYDYNGGNTDNDTIKFGEGISFEDLLFERDGNNLVIYVNNDKTQGITIQNYYSSYSQVEKLEFADGTIVETSSVSIVEPEEPSENAGQTISGTSDDDILIGSDGDDTINAEDGYNDITGGKGNDIISAGYDRDTFYYNLGDGYDKITDLGGRDQIIFGDGISKENISFYRKNDNLIISINDDFSQGIEIIDFFRNNDNRIENIKFADNSTLRLTTGLILKTNELDGSITGTVEDDTLIGNIGENNLNGSSGDDILNGGKGNDTLDGDVGNDTYIWNLGDDIDTIRDTAGLNTIKFGENISFDDLTFKQDGNNLRLIVKNDISQGIIIQDYFSSNNINNNYHPITIFEFSDGSKFDFRENNITLTYDNRAETITGNIGDNIIDAQGGDDTITTYGGDDIINGGAGDDEISSGNGNDIITGGSGNDIINGEAGNDTYIWNLGDGMDTITDSSGFDKIKFGEGITSANLSFFKQGNNLLIFINDNHQEGIIINRYFEGSYNIELLEFTDGSSINLSQSLDIKLGDTGESIDGTIYNDTITGGDGNDTINGGNGDDTLSGGIGEDTMSGGDGADIISGGTGDDTIDGGAGNDTYIWNLGDGMDTITDSQGTDKIVFGEGISYDDLSFSQTNSDLYINVQNMPNQGLLIKNYFASGNSNRIETLEFSNGNLFDLSKNALILKGDGTVNGTIYDDSITGNNNDDTITAGDGNDIIYGNAGNDNIDGGNGDDMIYGGQGCDTLKGGYGNDTYVWNLGDDLDTIEDDAGQNTLLFGNGISFNDLDFNMLGNNLLITVNGDKNQGVQINNFLNENDLYKIEYLKFSDGTSIYLPDLGLNMAYGATDDTINGTYNDDTIIAGNGNDTVNAGDGNDSIYGGKGNDALNGGNGRDSYYYNLGDGYDTITETRGNDKIIFGEGISINNLSFRQDGSNLDILINNDVSQGVTVKDFYSGTNYQVETLQFADGSTFNLSTQGLTLQQTNADDTVNGTSYNDVIYGNGGHDTINAGDGNDTIVGGIGNDILNGGNGDDTYIYNLGDGFDTITDTGGDDKIVFGEGISQSDLSFEQIGNDLKISVNGKDDKGIQINNYFQNDASKIETIEFYDGSTLNISNADQLIQAMNSFSISNSASTDALSNPTENVSDMYSLAASQDLTRKAI